MERTKSGTDVPGGDDILERAFGSLASNEDIYYWFRLALGRKPNQGEWDEHVRLLSGKPLDSVAAVYLNSLEFAARASRVRGAASHSDVSVVELESFSIYVRDSDMEVGEQLRSATGYEPHVTSIFKSRLASGMRVVDIGANVGYFSLLASTLVGPSGHVTAFEPNANNVKLLELGRRRNRMENIEIVQAAAGRECGLLVLNSSVSNGTTSAPPGADQALLDATTVPCLRVDVVNGDQRIDFIKIDIEGAEYNALVGARDTILRCRPTIVSEFSPELLPGISGVSGEQYLGYVLGLGYRVSVIEENGSLADCGNSAPSVMSRYAESRRSHIDLLFEPDSSR